MTSEIITCGNAPNAFEQLGNSVSRDAMGVGAFMKFDRGDFPVGRDGELLPIGTRLVPVHELPGAVLAGLVGECAARARGGLVVEGYTPPRRTDLGDTDQATWEIGSDGQPKDPWQFSNALPLASHDGKTFYTFVTSKGGLSAIGELSKAHGRNLHVAPGTYPVIELSSGSYAHKDKSIGRVKYPMFPIIGWTEAAPFDATILAPPKAAPPRQSRRPRRQPFWPPAGRSHAASCLTRRDFRNPPLTNNDPVRGAPTRAGFPLFLELLNMTENVETEGRTPEKAQDAPALYTPNGDDKSPDSDAKVLKIARKGLQTPPKQVSDAKLLELAKEANQPAGNILGGGHQPRS